MSGADRAHSIRDRWPGRPAAASPAEGPLLGAHMSIAGGIQNAILAAARHRCRAVQLFSKSSNQWKARILADEDVAAWREAIGRHPMIPFVHDSYLINLSSPDPTLRKKSREAFVEEIRRCDLLGIPWLIFHPGVAMGARETVGCDRVAASLDWVADRRPDSRTGLLLETTAGQGSCLGHRFEHLARILDRARCRERLGVCIDTAHIHAAGYDIRTEEAYRTTFEEFDRIVGIERIRAFHVNDSKRELGSRVDRHEHIGRGKIGSRAFGSLMRDPRFRDVPKILETPKEGNMDRWNLALLRRLSRNAAIASSPERRGSAPAAN
ncbi:MAG: deoxyribonuclease IV [Candidatus Eisenbacteria bacterium]